MFLKHPNIIILSDEIYEYINFVGQHFSLASIPELKERVVIINGLSKGFAMTGWRIGYIAASVEIAKACERYRTIHQRHQLDRAKSCRSGAHLGSTTHLGYGTGIRQSTQTRAGTCAGDPGHKVFCSRWSILLVPDMSAYYGKSDGETTISNAADLSMYLLNKAHVSSVMGDAFGEPTCVRFSFANSLPKIEEGWARIKQALSLLR